jgi:protein-S-isoprenylcysteine O-methyltransferase Ste14
LETVYRKVRHALEALTSLTFFLFQYMPLGGPWFGFMFVPLASYIFSMLWLSPDLFKYQLPLLLFSERLMLGRVVAIAGFVIFLTALIQYLTEREKLKTSGLYSIVRHPQYFGMTIMTLGISMMCVQHAGFRPEFLYAWLIQVFGYVLLAGYEERYLLKKYANEFLRYKETVPFILPIPRLHRIHESLLVMMVIIVISFLVTLL